MNGWTLKRRAKQAAAIRRLRLWEHSAATVWTAERRARQAAAIRRWRPWERSTGPRTPTGKAESARNAFKGSNRPWFRAMDVIHGVYRRNPGAKTLAECTPFLNARELARLERAVATYAQRHPSKLSYISINGVRSLISEHIQAKERR